MADSVTAPAGYGTQADALLRKNLTFQKRNVKANIRLILVLIFLVLLIKTMEVISFALVSKNFKCGCKCVDKKGTGECKDVCGVEYSTPIQAESCEVKEPLQFRPLLQIPEPKHSAVKTDFIPYRDLPNESCRKSESCPAIILTTGTQLRNEPSIGNSSNFYGTTIADERTNYLDPAFVNATIFSLKPRCPARFKNNEKIDGLNIDVKCRELFMLLCNNPSDINEELHKGYTKGNAEKRGNEIAAAYDFLNTDKNRFNMSIWYNATYKGSEVKGARLTRVPPLVNMASNRFLQSSFFKGSSFDVMFEFVKEMPKHASMKSTEISATAGPILFSWVILQLFPVAFVALVYEKQQNLRIMMKMHGLKDGPYWTITYAYFLVISSLYMFGFVGFGSFINLKFFRSNAYSIQFIFYFIYINLQIAWAFLLAGFFSDVKTATVMGYMVVFASGLLGSFFFSGFLLDSSISEGWIVLMELYPGFSLYRGLFEFGEYSNYGAFTGEYVGMQWENLNDPGNGIKEAIIIMLVEWIVVLLVAFYLDQINSSGKSPLFSWQTPGISRRYPR